MRLPVFLIACLLVSHGLYSQVKIHSHNDYEKPQPLVNAIHYKAFIIEADVYVDNGNLLVAHHRNEIDSSRTLSNLYLEPIIKRFEKYHGLISDDSAYSFNLMIDMKDRFEAIVPLLLPLLEKHPHVFDRRVNPKAVQVVISGNRGQIDQWIKYPVLLFDGRPGEEYSPEQIAKVAYISDSYYNHVSRAQPLQFDKLKPVIEKSHSLGKLIRFWGGPDNAESWRGMKKVGVDIINTDRVEEVFKLQL